MKQIHVDTLVLVDENDWICPPVVAERIHSSIQGSTIRFFLTAVIFHGSNSRPSFLPR